MKQRSSSFQSAVEKEPDNASHHYNLATALRARGDIPGAEKSLNRALELNPDDPDALTLRSGLRKQTAADNHIATLEQALDRVEGQPRKQAAICYALAKELEDLDDGAASFAFLRKGGDIRRKHINYDIGRDLSRMEKIREVYDDTMFARGIEGFTDASPIFVIGMPCTGTTLVERILGRHSVVKAAGELNNFLLQLVRLSRESVPGRDTSGTFLIEVSAGLDFEALGKAYIGSIRAEREEHPFFVDKMPVNFLYAGLIHLALPKAKIIHMQRDPMDTCYAVYKTQFEAAYPYSYDLTEIAEYYAAFDKLMAHWHRVLPGVMHTIRYEELVTDTEALAKEMLSYCDLSWEAECLRYSESAEYDTTASTEELSMAIDRESIGRWKRYEEQLRPVSDILQREKVLSPGGS